MASAACRNLVSAPGDPDFRISAALAVEALGLRPAQLIRLGAIDANPAIRDVVANYLDDSLDPQITFLPCGADRRELNLGGHSE